MEIVNDDYYKGYEGEGEINIVREKSNGDYIVIKIRQAYFDTLMSGAISDEMLKKPSDLKGLLKCYYDLSGFYDGDIFYIDDICGEIKNISGYNQDNLYKNNVLIEPESFLLPVSKLKQELIKFLKDAISYKDKVYVCLE